MALPGLSVEGGLETPDLRVQIKRPQAFAPLLSAIAESFYRSSDVDPSGLPNLRVGLFPDREYFGFFYGDGMRFAVQRQGREVLAGWPENYTLEDACTYLLGPVMGFVLRLRGTVCLHASAVAVEDRAIALVGLPGAGKSTTAAAFACSGFPVLSDDIVALSHKDEQWIVQPGYPRVNLWPDSALSLFGSEDALPHITPTWDKRYLPLGENSHRFASNSLPLGAIYILECRDPRLNAPIVELLSAKEALISLVANTYVNYLLDQNMRRTEFDVLSCVVSGIPVRRVRLPDDPSAIFNLCEVIADDARRVVAAIPANATLVHG
jgi:hypothetical protein